MCASKGYTWMHCIGKLLTHMATRSPVWGCIVWEYKWMHSSVCLCTLVETGFFPRLAEVPAVTLFPVEAAWGMMSSFADPESTTVSYRPPPLTPSPICSFLILCELLLSPGQQPCCQIQTLIHPVSLSSCFFLFYLCPLFYHSLYPPFMSPRAKKAADFGLKGQQFVFLFWLKI